MKWYVAVVGGGLVGAGGFIPAWQAYVAIGVLASLLGWLFARAERGSAVANIQSTNTEALSLLQITHQTDNQRVAVYFSAHVPGIYKVTKAFVARIDGQQGLILETD